MFTSMQQGFENMADALMNGIVYQNPSTDLFSQNSSGVAKWIEDGSFAPDFKFNYTIDIDAKVLKAVWAAAVSLLWRQEGVYFVNTTDAQTFTTRSYKTLHIKEDDITRFQLGNEIFFAIKHTKDASPIDAYSKVPGIKNLPGLGLDIQEVANTSAWSQRHIGYNETWPIELVGQYATSTDDPPPGGIFMTIPVCHLGQLQHVPFDVMAKKGCNTINQQEEVRFHPMPWI
ncbi:hypothetical protein N7512_005946 [Penicillium capsulatum]|nr:hypothetical protein N7512_005946 [Penicillium capsulatum]